MTPQEQVTAYRKSAEAGDASAQCSLGAAYEKGVGVEKNAREALRWYKKSADQGYAYGQYCVGWYYFHGLGVEKNLEEAARYYILSTDSGNAFAPFYLAGMYAAGTGVQKNEAKAERYYRVSADRGYAKAQCKMGWLYSHGELVTKDHSEAYKWYLKAAEQGDDAAANNIGWMYEGGIGIPKDLEKAIAWYRIAVKAGSAKAKEHLERLKVPVDEPAEEEDSEPAITAREKRQKIESSECKPLFNACTQFVYAHNAFRITGLFVDASTRDLKRRVDDLKAAAENDDDEDEHTHAFALQPTPTIDQIREAAQRLQEPELRVIDEFFWFWPLDWEHDGSDKALLALRNGNKDAAFKIWSEAIDVDFEPDSIVAKHNVAVMYQMVALDSEILALNGEFSSAQLATVEKYWTRCFQWWEELADDETFWSIFADRIRRLDDQRLTTGFARRMRATFPIAFDRINALLAMQYAEKGKYDQARRHINYMNQTHQGNDDVDRVISEIIKPLGLRIDSTVEKALEQLGRNPEKGAAIARELMSATNQTLKIVQTFMAESHSIRSYLFEQVSDACFSCLIAYGNKTSDWPTCVGLLKLTESLATTKEARDKIRQNIAQAEENHRDKTLYGTCWFCKKNPPHDASVLNVPMHGEVNREWRFGSTHVTWKKLNAKVPRCETCKEAHSKVGGAWTGAAAGAAVGTAVMPVIGSIIGLAIGAVIGRQVDTKMRLPEGVNPESTKSDYPPINEMIAKGWAIGERPT